MNTNFRSFQNVLVWGKSTRFENFCTTNIAMLYNYPLVMTNIAMV